MKALILGGYGFIGAEIMRALIRDGHVVAGLGRSAATGERLVPGAKWIGADMTKLDSAEKWAPFLESVEVVINAAGALQDSVRDNLEAVHFRSVAALVEAAEQARIKRFIQISAPGAHMGASTAFMRTKAAGDAAVRASSLEWVVLKPGLVISRNAYGGTALLRMLAGFPLMTPLVAASARVQTVSIDDLTDAVVALAKSEIPMRRDFELAEVEPHTLRDIVRGLRRQLGFAPARFEPDLPRWAGAIVGALADCAGRLGWRSALRSTALKVMDENVLADSAPWRAATGRAFKSFDETLAQIPGTAQERIYARTQLALPLLVIALGIFWIASGAIGFMAIDNAASHLYDVVGLNVAKAMVAAGSFADISIGVALLFRRTARTAALSSIAVAAFYLVAGTLVEPTLWLDPFGALAKIIPIMAAGISVALLMEER